MFNFRSLLVGLVASLSACATPAPSPGQEAATPRPEAPYRRVYAPADRPDAWPDSEGALVPVQRAEAARLLSLLANQGEPASARSAQSVQFYARMTDAELVGVGSVRFSRQQGRDAFVPWPRASMRIDNPRWEVDNSPALLGDWGAGPQPPFGLLVDHDGALLFDFRAAPDERVEARWEYTLGAPVAGGTTVVLDLPVGVQPSALNGLTSRQDPGLRDGLSWPDPPAGLDRWWVTPPPGGLRRLTLTKPAAAGDQTPKPFTVVQHTTHRVAESGVETHARFSLTRRDATAGTARLLAPVGSHITSVTQDGLPIAWRVGTHAAGGSEARINLRRGASWEATQLEVGLLTPEWESQATTLPTPRLENALWLAGSAEVWLEQGLELIDVVSLDYASLAAPVSVAPDHAALSLQLSRPEAVIRLQVGAIAERPSATVERSVTLMVNRDSSVHQAAATVRVTLAGIPRSAQRLLLAGIEEGWELASLTATPESALEEWGVDRAGAAGLWVRFAPVADADAETTVSLNATLTRPLPRNNAGFPLPGLTALDVCGARVEHDSLRLIPSAPYHLLLDGSPTPAPPVDAEASPNEVRFDAGQTPLAQLLAGGVAQLSVEPSRRLISSEVRVDSAGGEWRYHATTTVPGDPLGGECVLRFAPPLPDSATLQVGDAAAIPVSRFRPPGGVGEARPEGLLAVPTSGQDTVTLRARFTADARQPLDVPLPVIERSGAQRGSLVLVGLGGGRSGVRGIGLTATTPAPQAQAEAALSFDYEPARVGSHELSAVLTPQQGFALADQVRLLTIQTRLLDSGRVLHNAAHRVEAGAAEAALQLPAGAELLSAHDEAGLPIERRATNEGRVELRFSPLPTARSVEVSFEQPDRRWAPGRPLQLDGLTENADQAWTWEFRMPDAYLLRGEAPVTWSGGTSWRLRLFGPLLGRWSDVVFNPFSAASWASLAGDASGRRPATPWQDAPSASGTEGWNVRELECVGPAAPVVWLDNRASRMGAASVLAVAVACLTMAYWPRLNTRLLAAAAIAAVAALLLPIPLAVWATATWLGLVAGAMLIPLRRLLAPPRTAQGGRAWLTGPATPTVALLLIVGDCPAQAPTGADPLPAVIIPIDADGRPAGDKWYLGDAFLSRLNRLDRQRSSAAPADWVLTELRVVGALPIGPAAVGGEVERWTLQLDAWTGRRNTEVRLPLHAADAAWASKAMVDGIATPILWDESGDACRVIIQEPGRRRIVLGMTPVSERQDGASSLRVALPASARASLTLSVAPSLADVQAPDLGTGLEWVEAEDRYQADLAGQRELRLRWTDAAAAASTRALSCDQLQWLRLAPGGATLDVQCQVEGAAPLPQALTVRLPDELATGDAPAAELTMDPVTPWNPTLTRLKYAATLALPRESGLGRFEVRPLTPIAAALRSRLMAVSADASMAISLPAGDSAAAFDPRDFAARWDEAGGAPAPDRAAVATDVGRVWQVQADAKANTLEVVDQRMRLVLGLESATARLAISTNPASWPLGRIEVSVPESFRPINCVLRVGGQPLDVRTRRAAPNRVVVFSPPGVDVVGEAVLELFGTLAPLPAAVAQLPLLRAGDPAVVPLRVELRRLPDCVVTLENPPADAAFDDPSAGAGSVEPGVHVATFRLASQQDTPGVSVSRNNARYEVSSVTSHQRTQTGVSHLIVADVRVLEGGLGQVPLEFLGGPRQLQVVAPPGAVLTRAPEAGAARWRVTLPTTLARGEQAQLRLESASATAERSLPATLARFPGAARQELLVALNAGALEAEGLWLTEGLTAARGKIDAPTSLFAGPGWTLHQSDPQGRASVQWARQGERPAEAEAALQLVEAIADSAGRVGVSVRYYLAPNGAGACRLQTPEHCTLGAITLNAREPIVTREGGNRWQILLLDKQSPQVLTINATCSGDPTAPGSVDLPRLITQDGEPLRVRRAVASLVDSQNSGLAAPDRQSPIDDSLRDATVLVGMVATAGGAPPSDWWKSRLSDALLAVRSRASLPTFDPAMGAAVDEAIAFADSELAGLTTYQADDRALLPGDPAPERRRHALLPDGDPVLRLTVQAAPDHGWWSRLGVALLILSGVALAVRASSSPAAVDGLVQHRNTAIGLAGVVWWLWLPLGVAGLLLVTAAAASEFRERRHRLPSAG